MKVTRFDLITRGKSKEFEDSIRDWCSETCTGRFRIRWQRPRIPREAFYEESYIVLHTTKGMALVVEFADEAEAVLFRLTWC